MTPSDSEPADSEPAESEPKSGSEPTSGSEPVGSKSESGQGATYGTRSGPRLGPALIATLITIPAMVIVGFIVYAAVRPSAHPTPIESYSAAATVSADCERLLAELPQTFEGFGTKKINGDLASWSGPDGGDPVTVRCGVTRPAELAPSSRLQTVNEVQWFITDTVDGVGQAYVCVDHRPYVALWVPVTAGNASVTDVSAAIGRILPSGPLDFG